MLTLSIVATTISVLITLYTVFRVGFRADELWKAKERADRLQERVGVLESKVDNLYQFIWNRAEAEARVKHAIRSLN